MLLPFQGEKVSNHEKSQLKEYNWQKRKQIKMRKMKLNLKSKQERTKLKEKMK